jgi:hypothetical protein
MRLSGCAIGDLDPAKEGSEIAAVAESGEVFLVRRTTEGWKGEKVATLPGAAIQCAVADADPARPGEEIVVAGMLEGEERSGAKGAARLLWREGDAWKAEVIGEDEELVHGAVVGDFDPRHEGIEVLTVGFSGFAQVFGRVDGAWAHLGRAILPGPGKTAIPAKGGAVVACVAEYAALVQGEEVAFYPGDGLPLRYEVSWKATLLAAGAAQARVGTDGERLLYACDDGGLRLVDGDAVRVIHREAQKLRGAVLADLDPSQEGIEAATTGYGKALTILYPPAAPDAPWTPVVPWKDEQALHHLAAVSVHGHHHNHKTVPGEEVPIAQHDVAYIPHPQAIH